MENNNNKTEKKSLGYFAGQIAGLVVMGCVTAILIALTIRLIGWILI